MRQARQGEGASQDESLPDALPRSVRLAPAPQGFLPAHGGRGSAPACSNLVLLGEFGRAHGLRGEVRLKSFTAEPAAIAGYGALVDGRGRRVALASVRPAGGAAPDMLIARVEGVTTREAAEGLNGSPLLIPRERLPAPEEADEFFLADLIGLPAEDTRGQPLGTVMAIPNYGAGDLLEIAPVDGGPSALLPFTQAFVPVVDVAAKRIVVDPPDHLFEPDQDASDEGRP